MLICTIVSKIQPRYSNKELKVGTYSIEVRVTLDQMRASHSPKELVQREISRHLAGCVRSTGIPLGESQWDVIFSERAKRMFDFPGGFTA